MNERQERFERVLDRLRTDRDELRVKAHLAKAEARDEWEKLEFKWREIESRLKAAGHEAKGAGGGVKSAVELLAEELEQGYRKIRRRLH
jgi:hypothetical protein